MKNTPDFNFNLGKLWVDHITKVSEWLLEKLQEKSSIDIICDIHLQTVDAENPDGIIKNTPYDFLDFHSPKNVRVDKNRSVEVNFSIDESSQSVRLNFLNDNSEEALPSIYLLLKDFEKPEVIEELKEWIENLTEPVFLNIIDRAS